MTVQRSTFVTPTVSGGVVSPSAASVISDINSGGFNAARLYVRLTTALCSDSAIIQWMKDLVNSGFLSLYAAPPENVDNWVLSANHTTALAWFDAVCGIKFDAFHRMIKGVLADFRPWTSPGSFNQTTKEDWDTLNAAMWTRTTTFDTNPWNPPGNPSLQLMNSMRYNIATSTMLVGGVAKVISSQLMGHGLYVPIAANDITDAVVKAFGPLCAVHQKYWTMSLGFSARINGSRDVLGVDETFYGSSKAFVGSTFNALRDWYTDTQYEVPFINDLCMDDLTAYKALS